MALIKEILIEDGYEQCKRCASFTFHVMRTATYLEYECANCGAGIRLMLTQTVDPASAVEGRPSPLTGG